MLAIKNQLNSMKARSELSEERIRKFESKLNVSKHQLETALLEKEALHRKIEAVEMQIINANKLCEDMQERCKNLEVQIYGNDKQRKELQDRELVGDNALIKVQEGLKCLHHTFNENRVRCEEAEQHLQSLNAESKKVCSSREKFEKQVSQLEKEIETKLSRVIKHEDFERKALEGDDRQASYLRLLESYYRDAEERKEAGRIKITRLQRIVEQTEDEIESLQLRSRAAQVELQNIIHTTVYTK